MARPAKEFRDLLLRDHTLYGGIVRGIDGHIVEMQARAMEVFAQERPFNSKGRNHDGRNFKTVQITGMAKGAVQESLDRIQGAFTKLQIAGSPVSIVINLAPAGLPKEGTWLDLPIAILLLLASGYLPDVSERVRDHVWFGEVGLHGEIRTVPGTLSIAFASEGYAKKIVLPSGNENEGRLVKFKPSMNECAIHPVHTLQEVIDFFAGKKDFISVLPSIIYEDAVAEAVDFSTIRGQKDAKRAALISAAGGHNLLLIGPPGEGKSLIASALPGILPKLTQEEMVELTRIYSACGKLESNAKAVKRRPVRTINRTATAPAVFGGGIIPKPGEITLAHLGVLFMDEFPEFSNNVLEGLRAPMETGVVSISRHKASFEFPARFTLVAAMNPCPCGYYSFGNCKCKQSEVEKYQTRISGPILDRIDLQVNVPRLNFDERFADQEQDQSLKYRQKVQNARERQHHRFTGTDIPFNAAIAPQHLLELCNFSVSAFSAYKHIVANNNISTRSTDRLAKVARTIADIEDSDRIKPDHVQEAAKFIIGGLLRDVMR